jgi:endonuclease/exonuclease/phosphatase family metal-dependent hydrolase
MRVLLYNMRYGAGTGPTFHLPFPGAGYLRDTQANASRIAEFVAAEAPDVVALCEVDSGSRRSGGTHQAQLIAERLGHGWHFACKYRAGSWLSRAPLFRAQGNAVLTRDGVSRYHDLGHGVKRLAIEVELPDAQLFVVHLALGASARQRQLESLTTLVRAAHKPVIVAGDLNTFSGAQELARFRSATGLRSADPHARHSFPSHAPRLQLDWILHGDGLSVERFAMPRVGWSDHLPLVADFRVH